MFAGSVSIAPPFDVGARVNVKMTFHGALWALVIHELVPKGASKIFYR